MLMLLIGTVHFETFELEGKGQPFSKEPSTPRKHVDRTAATYLVRTLTIACSTILLGGTICVAWPVNAGLVGQYSLLSGTDACDG